MAKERIGMRKIKEVLRLGYENKVSMRKIALCCNLGIATVLEYFRRFRVSGLPWPPPVEINDEALESRLFPKNDPKRITKEPPDYEYLFQEMKKPNVTLAILWEEYKQVRPTGYQYSQFCDLYRKYIKSLNYSMRQEHKAGEKTFVDFGKGLNLVDPKTGAPIPTQLFVSVWGASNYAFAAAVLGEDLSNWIGVNVSALEYYGCCPKAIVPDNLKSAVARACRYEPELNPTYAEFARHYDLVIFPARPYRARDKAKVENGVRLAKRWILAKLRNRIFFSLSALNAAIYELLEVLNNKLMKRIKKSRKERFEVLDRPNAQPLPDRRYEFAEWKTVRVSIDYHVCFDDHYYSVPYTLIHQELEIRATRNIIEVFKKGERICSHQRSYHKHKYTTKVEHMPKSHQQYLEWTPTRILEWAAKYGPAVKELVEQIMSNRKYPEQAYRSCLGIIRLEKRFSAERLNNACRRALEYRVESYQGVKNILSRGLDKLAVKEKPRAAPIQHENIRGSKYYLSAESAYNRTPAPSLGKEEIENSQQIESALVTAH